MRLAVDLDGVLADLRSALWWAALRLFPEIESSSPADGVPPSETVADDATDQGEPAAEPLPSVSLPSLTARQYAMVWREVCQTTNFWETLEEIESGAIRRLASLAQERRWEIIFITSRPSTAGDPVQIQSQRWLAENGFPLPSVFVIKGSRGKVADALGLQVVVDDRPENCLDVVMDSSARAILVWRDEGQAVPLSARRLNIGSVRSVAECLDLLVEADQPGPAAGAMNRLKRLLGIGSRSELSRSGR